MSKKYLNFIRSKPCLICEAEADVVAHHFRLKGTAGIGIKPPDRYCVPLCVKHHTEIHAYGLLTFFKKYNIIYEDNEAYEYIYKTLFKLMSEYAKEE